MAEQQKLNNKSERKTDCGNDDADVLENVGTADKHLNLQSYFVNDISCSNIPNMIFIYAFDFPI